MLPMFMIYLAVSLRHPAKNDIKRENCVYTWHTSFKCKIKKILLMIDLMESFFAILRQKTFYSQGYNYKNLEELTKAIVEYIHHYKEDRINERLKSLTPKECQTKAKK